MKKSYSTFGMMLFAITFSRSQNLVSVAPSSASAGQTLNVTITGSGTHFMSGSGTTLHFGFDQCSGTVVNSMIPTSNTSISANITVPMATYNNLHDVEVYNVADGYMFLDHTFDIPNGNAYPVSLSPNSAAAGQTLNVSITGSGTHFMQGSSSTLNIKFDITQRVCFPSFLFFPGNPSSNTAMTSTFSIPPGTDTGYYDISILGGPDNLFDLQNLFHVTGPTAVHDLENDYHLEISPNPFSNATFLNYSLSNSETVIVELFDLFGSRILEKILDKQMPGSHAVKIDAAVLNMMSGIYYLRFSSGSINVTRKILVSR